MRGLVLALVLLGVGLAACKDVEVRIPSSLALNTLHLVSPSPSGRLHTRVSVAVWSHPLPVLPWQVVDDEFVTEADGDFALDCPSLAVNGLLPSHSLFPPVLMRDPFAYAPPVPSLHHLGVHALYGGDSEAGTRHMMVVGVCNPPNCPHPPLNSTVVSGLRECELVFMPSAPPQNTSYDPNKLMLHDSAPTPPWLRAVHIAHRLHRLTHTPHPTPNATTTAAAAAVVGLDGSAKQVLPCVVPNRTRAVWTVPSSVLPRGDEEYKERVRTNTLAVAGHVMAQPLPSEGGELFEEEMAHDDLPKDTPPMPVDIPDDLLTNDERLSSTTADGDKTEGVAHGFLAGYGNAVLGEGGGVGVGSKAVQRHQAAVARLKALGENKPSDDAIAMLDVGSDAPSFRDAHCTNHNAHRICDIGGRSAMSVMASLNRMRSDLKTSLGVDLREAVSTQASNIIKMILPPLLLALLTPLLMLLIQLMLPYVCKYLVPPVAEAVEPTVVLACIGIADTALGQAIEATLFQILSEGMKNILRRALSWALPRAIKKTLPRAIAFYVLNFEGIAMAKPIAHGVVHTVTHSFTQQAGNLLPPAISRSVNHLLMQRLQRYEYCVYCYYHGKFCDECDQYAYQDPSPAV